jgi:molybdenum cofactor synthesis domain-containing protein
MGRVSGNGLSAAVVTVSDGVTHGTRRDESGDVAEAMLRAAGFEISERAVLPDERPAIEALLRQLADRGIGLVVTTGGTGFGPRDVTPEATRAVLEREAPGLTELMRAAGMSKTPMAALSRAIAGATASTLIVNLPGSPRGVHESLEAVLPVARHAVELLSGSIGEHPTGHEGSTAGEPRADEAWVDVKAVRVHGSPPCQVGNAMRIVPDGSVHGTLGCAEFDEAAVRDAEAILATGEPQVRRYQHEHGDVEVYLEPHRRAATLVLVSATDVARELVRLGPGIGLAPVLVESRTERVTSMDRASSRVVDALTALDLDDEARVVFTDHDAPGIAGQLAHVLGSPARFIGVMGSRRHVGPYVAELRAMGFADQDLARLRSPLGLDLGGRRADEIALAIAAGLVADTHGRDGGWLDR